MARKPTDTTTQHGTGASPPSRPAPAAMLIAAPYPTAIERLATRRKVALLGGSYGQATAWLGRPGGNEQMALHVDGSDEGAIDLLHDVTDLEVVSQAAAPQLKPFFGWLLAGALVGGWGGAIVGSIWGAQPRNQTTFSARLRNGKQITGVTDTRTYNEIVAARA
jgi:hypothetical protein